MLIFTSKKSWLYHQVLKHLQHGSADREVPGPMVASQETQVFQCLQNHADAEMIYYSVVVSEDKLRWMLGRADICWLLSWFSSSFLLAKFKMEKLNLHVLLPLLAILQATSTRTPPICCTYRYCVWTSSCCHWSLLSSVLQWIFLILLPAYAVPFQHIIIHDDMKASRGRFLISDHTTSYNNKTPMRRAAGALYQHQLLKPRSKTYFYKQMHVMSFFLPW